MKTQKIAELRTDSLVSLVLVVLLASLWPQTAQASLPPAVFDFAVYATGAGCEAIKISGNASVDSFDSSLGSYSQTRQLSKGIVGVSGNITLSGNVTINGPVFATNATEGSCRNGTPGITTSGKATATGGYIQLSAAPTFPNPDPITAGSQDVNVTANGTLVPGSYRNIAVSGGAILTLSPGAYNINALTLSGQSSLTVNPAGQVVINLAGAGVSQPMDLTGGSIVNGSGIPLNLQFIYGGSLPIRLSGGDSTYAVLYAPNAPASLHGGSEWFGSMVVQTLDDSGNTSIHYDRSLAVPPSIVPSISPSPTAFGWNNFNPTVTFTCSDPILGIDSCTSPVLVTTEGANQNVPGTAVNRAGFSATASATVNFDKTVPIIGGTSAPPANGAGWNNSPVTASFDCADVLSGIASCTAPRTFSAEGANQTVNGTAVDKAGNSASAQVTFSIDRTPPVITGSVSPAPNAAGWINSDATVTFNCSDALSGVGFCTAPVTLKNDGNNQLIVGTAVDRAGNTAPASMTVKLDKTPPSVTISSPANGSTISLSTASITVVGIANDTTSGLAGVTCNDAPATLSGPNFKCTVSLLQGPNTIAIKATDVAGNSNPQNLNLTYAPAPLVTITSPANLSVTNLTPVTVNGTINDPGASLKINGILAPQSAGIFSIPVPLVEGLNVLSAIATNANGVTGTATAQVTLDTTPPHITIDSPADGATTTDAIVTVTGIANDVVVGTVNAQDAQVTINGIPAQVANRTYSAANVPLSLGKNTIQAAGRDRAGNGTTTSINVTRVLASQPPAPAIGNAVITYSLSVVSGNNQTGTIGTPLSAPLVVALSDSSNKPVANQTVVFQVTNGNGSLSGAGTVGSAVAVSTNGSGQAQVFWTLGQRAGAGINTVQVSSALAFATANFTATASTANATQIVVDSGNNQTGVLGQPLPFPFVAIVTDSGFNRVPGVPVTFSVTQGGGNIDGAASKSVTTDSNGRAIGVLTIGLQDGVQNTVETTFPGNRGRPVVFTAVPKAPGNPANTTISGVVLDNSNNPISGVTLRLFQTNQGNFNNLPVQIGTPVQSNAQGTFRIPSAPVGFFKLMADGTTASGPKSYPTLEYDIVTVAGVDNTVGMPIYLPALDKVNKLCVDETTGGTLTLPQYPGFALTVLPGSATFPGGSHKGCVSVTPVNGDKVPMSPGFGQQPRFVVTIQPVGTSFNPPAPITLPNVDRLAPKSITEMYSYDHDLSMFVAIGTGTVSSDGSKIVSNPGVGVLKAGWHCGGNPNSSGDAASLAVTLTAPGSATAGTTVDATANGTPPLDGKYVNWEVIDDPADPDDDATVATFVTSPSCDGQASCTAQLMGKKIGTASIRVTFVCTTTGDSVTSSIVKVKFSIGLKVKEVTFSDDIDIFKDRVGSAPKIMDPVWKDTNTPDQNDPVAYVRASTMKVTVKFAVNPVPTSPVSNVTIEGQIPGLGKFRKTGVTIPAAAEMTVSDITADTALPNTTKFYNPMTINWKSMADGKNCPACDDDGSTANKVYVTLATPIRKVFLTSLNLAVSDDGATNQQQAFDKTWAKFSGPANVQTWDSRPLFYYKNGFGTSAVCPLDEEPLLTRGDSSGQCSAFAQLLMGSIAVNGIAGSFVAVNVIDGDQMVVKDWTFSATPTFPAAPAYKWKMVFNPAALAGGDLMVPSQPGGVFGDLTNKTTLPGQNTAPPSEKVFARHFIVKFTGGTGGPYFDPSYGVTYTNAADFESKAVDGYGRFFVTDAPNEMRVRRPGGGVNISLVP